MMGTESKPRVSHKSNSIQRDFVETYHDVAVALVTTGSPLVDVTIAIEHTSGNNCAIMIIATMNEFSVR